MSQNNPNLRTQTKFVKAGGQTPVDVQGSFISCINITASGGNYVDATLAVTLGSSGNNLRFNQGDKYRTRDGETFFQYVLVNTGALDLTVTVGVGDGDISNAQQVSISGTVQSNDTVAQSKLDTLHADNVTIEGKLDTLDTDIQAIKTALQTYGTAGTKKPLTTLAGASYAARNSAGTTTVVTGAANTAGIIIHRMGVTANENEATASIQFGGNILLDTGGTAAGTSPAAGIALIDGDLFLPSGSALTIVCVQNVATQSQGWVWYTKL